MRFTVEIDTIKNLYMASQVEASFPNDKIELAKLYTHLHEVATNTCNEKEPNLEDSYIITFIFDLNDTTIKQMYSSVNIPIYFDAFIEKILALKAAHSWFSLSSSMKKIYAYTKLQ